MTRLLPAAGIATLGVACCVANDWWYAHYSDLSEVTGYHRIEVSSDLFLSVPFWLAALLLAVRRLSLATAVVVVALLAALTSYSYFSAETSQSSTAPVAYIGIWAIGIPLVLIAVVIDEARQWRNRSQRSRVGSADGRHAS